jgi:hypothetical protein
MSKSIVLFLESDKLDTKARKSLPEEVFALPNRRYPIHDVVHARSALAYISRFGTDEEKAKVRAAVHKRYPEIGAKHV